MKFVVSPPTVFAPVKRLYLLIWLQMLRKYTLYEQQRLTVRVKITRSANTSQSLKSFRKELSKTRTENEHGCFVFQMNR